MRQHTYFCLFIVLFISIFTANVRPQEKPVPQPAVETAPGAETVRARSLEVVVDAVITDKRNRPVLTLKPDDFTVYENDVPQRIMSVRLERGEIQTVAPGKTTTAPPTTSTAPPVRRTYTIILLDYSTTEFQNEKLVREAVEKYVRERMRPEDRVTVFVLGTGLKFLVPFTNDKNALVAAVRTSDVWGTALAAEHAALKEDIARQENIAAGGIAQNAADTTQPSTPAQGQAAAQGGPGKAERAAARRMSDLFSSLKSQIDQRSTREILAAIKAIALGAQGIEGRKSLIVFSQGFVVNPLLEDVMRGVISDANRANVAVYCIDSRGLEYRQITGQDELRKAAKGGMEETNVMGQSRVNATGGETIFDRTVVAGRDIQESGLRYISNQTGGLYLRNSNDLALGMARVEEESHTYYTLTYRPADTRPDGTFRKIRVEVKQPGVTVRSRGGYYAMPPGLEMLPPDEMRLVADARRAPSSEQLFVRAAGFRLPGGDYRVPVILELPSNAIHFQKAAGRYTAQLRILGVARDTANPDLPATRFGGPTQVNLSEAQYADLAAGSVSFVNPLRLPSGSYQLEVIAQDAAANKLYRQELGLYLRDAGKDLALSTILLANRYEKAAPGTAGQDGFLVSQGVRIMPSAQCRFRSGENMVFYFDVYNAGARPDTSKSDLVVGLALLKDGKRLPVQLPRYQVTEPASAKPEPVTLARYINLANLAAGDYSLIVEVKDQVTNGVARAHASFSVD